MGLIEDCENFFQSKNLYDVLSVQKNASPSEIKKAYRKASLLVHPDRAQAGDQNEATRKFQILSKAHLILSDAEKRAVYDETGLIDEENCISENDSNPEFWNQYWRNLFPKITVKDIDNFLDKYKGSEEELMDLKEVYCKYEGDMSLISDAFIGYKAEKEDEIRNLLMDMINKEEIPSFPKFINESKTKKAARMKRHKSEKKEAEEMMKQMDNDLLSAISRRTQERENQFNSMIHNLEAKYCKMETKGKKKKH